MGGSYEKNEGTTSGSWRLLGFLLKIGVIFEVKLHMKPVENKGPDEVRLTFAAAKGERDLLMPASFLHCLHSPPVWLGVLSYQYL